MKRIKKWSALAIGLLTAVCMMVGCTDKGAGTPEDTFPYYPQRTQMKEDGQYYAPEGVEFPASLWQTPASERYEALDRGEIKAYFIQSVDDTKVFCYVGLPEGASAEDPVPAVVLVHGALGTAFYDWVRAWNDRGYAAVAMDTEGRMPKTDTSTYNAVYETSVMPHGPANASFTDCTKPIGEQWVYHALASVIASASFLKSFAGVDSSLMGITGVSYGGFLTCLAVGYDDRYAFAAPVYGCLSNAEGAGEFGSYIRNNEGADLWDDTGALAAGNAPILFVNSDTDTHFTLDSMARCIRAAKYGAATVIPGLTHGHAQGAEVREVFAFADEICLKKTPLVRVLTFPENGEIGIAVPESVKVSEAVQRYTLSETVDSSTEWAEEKATLSGGYVFVSAEKYKRHYYILLRDSRGLYAASVLV